MTHAEAPFFETSQNRRDEQEIASTLEKAWHVRLAKLPDRYYQIDRAALWKDRILAWVEIKCRSVKRKTYPTYMIDYKKWVAGVNLHDETGLPFLLAIRFTDGIWVYSYDPKTHAKLRWGGRTDRGVSYDVKPMIHLPLWEFKKLHGKRITEEGKKIPAFRVPKYLKDNLRIANKIVAAEVKEKRRG